MSGWFRIDMTIVLGEVCCIIANIFNGTQIKFVAIIFVLKLF